MGNYLEDKVREQQAQSGTEREKQKKQILGNKRQKEKDVKANNIFAWIVQYLGKISLKEKKWFQLRRISKLTVRWKHTDDCWKKKVWKWRAETSEKVTKYFLGTIQQISIEYYNKEELFRMSGKGGNCFEQVSMWSEQERIYLYHIYYYYYRQLSSPWS